MYRRKIPTSAPSLSLAKRKFPTLVWRRFMSSTRKPPARPSSVACNSQPAAEVAVAEAAQFEAAGAAAAQFEPAGVAAVQAAEAVWQEAVEAGGGEAAEDVAVVVVGRGGPADSVSFRLFSFRFSWPDLMRIGLGGGGVFATLPSWLGGSGVRVAPNGWSSLSRNAKCRRC
jgi:hypothetical protein